MKKLEVLSLVAATLSLGTIKSHAAVVIQVDVSNPAAVTWTSTSANSAIDNGGNPISFDGGITMENFFTATEDITTAIPVVGDLSPSGTTTAYDSLVTFSYGSPAIVAGDDLSVFNSTASSSDVQEFSQSVRAFTGSSAIDFSGRALPSPGMSGNVNAGFAPFNGGTIGTWVVVPEPSTWAVAIGAGCVLFAAGRRLVKRVR